MLAVGAVQYLSESTALTRSHHPLVLPPAPHPRWRHLRQIKTLWTGISYMHVGVDRSDQSPGPWTPSGPRQLFPPVRPEPLAHRISLDLFSDFVDFPIGPQYASPIWQGNMKVVYMSNQKEKRKQMIRACHTPYHAPCSTYSRKISIYLVAIKFFLISTQLSVSHLPR